MHGILRLSCRGNRGDIASVEQAGLDSLGTLELRNAIADAIGLELPATAAFDYPTTAALAAHIAAQLAPAGQGAQGGPHASPASGPAVLLRTPQMTSEVVGMACVYPTPQPGE